MEKIVQHSDVQPIDTGVRHTSRKFGLLIAVAVVSDLFIVLCPMRVQRVSGSYRSEVDSLGGRALVGRIRKKLQLCQPAGKCQPTGNRL